MKHYVILIVVAMLTALIAFWVGTTRIAKAPIDGVACTQEAKLCPDGSAVGRTGPNCEFAKCPTANATSTAGGGENDSILPYTSGVRGTVLLGPTCPVLRDPPDPQCADKPYATAIVVYRANSTSPFLLGNSNANGAFTLALPPGSYTLQAKGGATLPRCNEVSVVVPTSGYVTTNISCDTGIR